MEWKNVKKDGLPKTDSMVLVFNQKGWITDPITAIFNHKDGVFLFYNPVSSTYDTLEVTHYIQYSLPNYEQLYTRVKKQCSPKQKKKK